MFNREKLWTVLSVVLAFLIFVFVSRNIRDIDLIIEDTGVYAPIVAIIVYAILAPTPVSTDPITVFTSVLFGPFLGIFVSWIGNSVGAIIEYKLGKGIAKSRRFSKIVENLPFGLNRLPVSSPYVLIFGRTIPVYGGKVINLVAGINDVPFVTFLWTTLFINLVGAILLSLGGYGLIKFIHIR